MSDQQNNHSTGPNTIGPNKLLLPDHDDERIPSVDPSVTNAARILTSQPSLDADRVRFLRACDRCRVRKVKCDNNNPCSKCRASNLACTFNGASPKLLSGSRSGIGDASGSVKRSRQLGDESEDGVASGSGSGRGSGTMRRRKRSFPSPALAGPSQARHPPRILGIDRSVHLFSTNDGERRFIGSTSGMPLLDAARRLAYAPKPSSSLSTQPQSNSNPNTYDWAYLDRLLSGSSTSTSGADRNKRSPSPDMEEFFPGREPDTGRNGGQNVFGIITAVIPQDLLASLLQIFFHVIHPSWPILHSATFFEELYRWSDTSFGVLLVAMCMLASRYTDDIRVLADPSDPTSAGQQYHDLFKRLVDPDHSNNLYELLGYFYASQFHCVNNVPRPLAHVYFSIAFARCIDAGLHRGVPETVAMSPIEREIRKRTAWAIFCWDKQIGALFGRHPFIRLWDQDVDRPEPFIDACDNAELQPAKFDCQYVEIFNAFVNVSAVLDYTLVQVVHRSVFPRSKFLEGIAVLWNTRDSDEVALKSAEHMLDEWRRDLHPLLRDRDVHSRTASPFHSVASEQVAGTEMLITLLIAGRRLILATVGANISTDDGQDHNVADRSLRIPVIITAKDLIQSCVQMGASDLLRHCDMLVVYRILVATRLILACFLSAKAGQDLEQMVECRQSAQAASILLHMLVASFPIALGAAELLDETCRVCGVDLAKSTVSPYEQTQSNRKMWHRPLTQVGRSKSRDDTVDRRVPWPNHVPTYTETSTSAAQTDMISPDMTFSPWLNPVTEQPTSTTISSLHEEVDGGFFPEGSDLSWLFPGAQSWPI